MVEERDVVIVGGGIAGLVCAHRLRELEPVVLEASRSGRRTHLVAAARRPRAQRRRAHVPAAGFGHRPARRRAGPRGDADHRVDAQHPPRRQARARHASRAAAASACRCRRPAASRSLVPACKVKRDADAYMRLIEPRPGGHRRRHPPARAQASRRRDVPEFLGRLHPEAFRIFQALANRSLAEPEEISQSAMAALFGHVWDTGDLGRNMRGGSGLLPDALGRALGPIVRVGCRVESVRLDGAGVRVALRRARTGPARSARARRSWPCRRRTSGHPRRRDDPGHPRMRSAHVTFGPMVVSAS